MEIRAIAVIITLLILLFLATDPPLNETQQDQILKDFIASELATNATTVVQIMFQTQILRDQMSQFRVFGWPIHSFMVVKTAHNMFVFLKEIMDGKIDVIVVWRFVGLGSLFLIVMRILAVVVAFMCTTVKIATSRGFLLTSD